jgi:hypothetical protein
MFRTKTKSFTAMLLAGSVLALAIGTPASAGFFDRKKKYVSTNTNVNERAYSIGNTGRDSIALSNIRQGAVVGDSVQRFAPTTNYGSFSNFKNFQGVQAQSYSFKGVGTGRDFSMQNSYQNGFQGNNGLIDLSSGFGITTSGGPNSTGQNQDQSSDPRSTADTDTATSTIDTDLSL